MIGKLTKRYPHLLAPFRGNINDLLSYYERQSLKRTQLEQKFLFVAAMPKSGSTFLSRKLSEYLDWQFCHLSDLQGGCEFDIYRPALINLVQRGIVVQQHTLATEGNVEYLRRFGAYVIVTHRPLIESLLSFREHLIKESLRWPFAYFDSSFRSWPYYRQIDCLIDTVLPWLIHFYVRWRNIEQAGTLENKLLFLAYSEIATNEIAAISKVLQFNSQPIDHDKLIRILSDNRRDYRKRLERGERSPDELSEDQRSRIQSMLSYYRGIDFSPIFSS